MKFPKFQNILTRSKSSKSYNPQIIQSSNPPITQSSNRPIISQSPRLLLSRSPRLLLSLSLLLLLSTSLFAQNEANVWYFQTETGLDFNSGSPEVLMDGLVKFGFANATISDSLGNYLFSCDWQYYYSSNGSFMQNGDVNLAPGKSGLAIVKWPGKDRIYYVFTAGDVDINPGFFYSIVDMKLFNGQGAVIEKNVPVSSGWDVSGNVGIVKKEGTEDVWIITRKFSEDAMVAYLVDENGFHPDPVVSAMPDREDDSFIGWGNIKISPDKKFLIASYQDQCNLEICRFHANTGEIEYMYTIAMFVNGNYQSLQGIELSPDSKYFYANYATNVDDTTVIYQFDMKLITDSSSFINSKILVGTGSVCAMQLARDGKIYCTSGFHENLKNWLGVIHKPWIRGPGCMFEDDAVNLFPRNVLHFFPNILADYLLRFEWTGEPCQGYPIHFKPNFIPTPQTIQWNFDDGPGSTSWQLSPTHAFKNPGIHEVKVDVWYPSGRYEHTSREIEILPSPQPHLGPDTLICQGSSLVLNANCAADFFYWSNGQFGVSSITVSDSGTYWVKGKFSESGCDGYDTIHVGFHPPTTIDETNLVITPTTCNGASGSITGLAALGSTPYAYRWEDLSEVYFGSEINVFDLPAGQYILTITDGNGCETVSDVYTIEDAGNLQVLDIELTQPHCGRPDGQIIVHAFSPSGSELQYSIDDGATCQADSVFSGLISSSYVVRVSDENGCEGFYLANPVLLEDIPGPQVTQVNVTNETDGLGNGAIEIIATGSTTQLFFSIDSGNTFQANDGSFENVVCNMYYVVIKDENGCDTSFMVEVQNIILTYLHAITGEGGHCLGTTDMVPVNVDNFYSVATFHLKLSYNADNLQCEGFANVHPQLVDSLIGWVDQAAGEINLAWNSASPLTFTQTETVADLVFTTTNPGQGELAWYTGPTESYFTNASGNPIPAQFQTGEVKIYQPPEISMATNGTACEGQLVMVFGVATGNQPPIDYTWIYPNGDTSNFSPLFDNVTLADAGLYTLLATDRVGCTDQKSIELIVSENPVAAFHGTDTLELQTGDVLDAGAGMASYKWNTGDTTESIVIPSVGMYSVEMESLFGCLGTDSVYIKLTSDEISSNYIFIPNAFSPDGDGLNDTFMAIATSDYIQKFHMLIFDRWGGQIFESNDIFVGWDGTKHGTPLPGGMYTYKITYSIYPSLGDYSEQVRFGTVMLVR
jgi:gliding motility-associated-like protein